MEDQNTAVELLSPEQELELLSKRQEELRQKLNEKNQEKVSLTLNALSEAARKREEAEAQERLAIAEIARRKQERLAEEEAEQKLREEQAAKERREREAQLAREKAERAKREAELERVRRERAKAAQLEAELQKIEIELLRGLTVEETPAIESATSLHNPSHPLSTIFGTKAQVSLPIRDVDSVSVAKDEAAKHKEQSTSGKRWSPRPKSHRFVDQTVSADLERAIRAKFRMNANTTRCDLLSATWDGADLLKALETVLERLAGKPIGHDQLLAAIDATLSEAVHGQA